MAGTAGSVAPVFRAEGYVATNIYDFYHAIIHNNKLYFCRQDGTIGHEPTGITDEYWFLSLDGNFGDATKLGGESAAQWQTKIDVEKARIDALITLEESGELTDIEKEVNDIKVGADGVTYGSAGTAVREQISSVKSDLGEFSNEIAYVSKRFFCEYGNVRLNGDEVDSTTYIRTPIMDCTRVKTFEMTRASNILISAYRVRIGDAWASGNDYITNVGNKVTVDDSVNALRLVFYASGNTEITQEQIDGTYVDACTEMYNSVEQHGERIETMQKRVDWSIARYPFKHGTVDIRNTEITDSTQCMTDEVDVRNVKTFKIVRPNNLLHSSAIKCVNGTWGSYPVNIDANGIVTIDKDVDYFRIVFRKADSTEITENELESIYMLPYIDANVRMDELAKEIDKSKDQINVQVEGDGYSSRFLHTANRFGTGKKPMWTIIDDDGRKEVIDVWLPIMQAKNIPITIPLLVGNIGTDADFMTWEEVQTMSDNGAEICSHTQTHADLSTLTESELHAEFSTSLGNLLLHGYNNPYLVYPYNRYNDMVMRVASEYFDCAVGLKTALENNVPPIDTYALTRREIGNEQTLDECKSYIDNIVANNGWLITMSHAQDSYMLHPEIIEQMIDYAKQKGVEIVTLREGLKQFGNVMEIGTSWDNSYTGISAEGKPFGNLNKCIIENIPSGFTGKNIFDCFPKNTISYVTISSGNGSTFGYPDGSSGGVLEVFRSSGNYYNYMNFTPLGKFKTYRCEYNNGWSEWTEM